MSIYLNKDSKIIVQGMTGSEGMKHTRRMLASGTQIVGGVNPRKRARFAGACSSSDRWRQRTGSSSAA